jgi:HK97 family phage portal protein
VQPNEDMGAFTFKKMLVQYIYLRGNAFVKLFRKSDNSISKLELLPSDNVQVILVDGHKKYVDTRTSEILDEADCIHIMGYSETGHIGISIVQTGALALGISYASETQALDYFEGNVTGILTPKTGTNISQEKALKAKENWINALSTKLGNSGSKIAVLDSSLEYQQINVSAKDSQLLESRKFNATTISQITGVPPNKLFDYTKASFANNEAANIAFLTDTLTPLLEKIENEFYRKIFNRVEYDTTDLRFNPDNLLRLDSVATANYLSSLFQIGGINSNEIRERIGANNPVSGGNRNFVQVNVQPLDNLISEQPKVVASGNTSTQQTNFIDNKLKA